MDVDTWPAEALMTGNAWREPLFRRAGADDADRIAALHADSWRRFYRGAYADSYLDGDVLPDRRATWSAWLASPADSETVVAERDDRLVGFARVVFDSDPKWGSLLDNLHVLHDQRRTGLGTQLLGRTARAIGERASGKAMYLWVLQQNTAAQRFYRSCGATCVEEAKVPPPGGGSTRLHGAPVMLRMTWPDVTELGNLLRGGRSAVCDPGHGWRAG